MHISIAIIGGGIVGLLIAKELVLQHPDKDIVLFEKEPFLGEHSTHRNSCVLHAGLYYPKNSLKRELCISGKNIWHSEYSEFVNKCGKYLIATDSDENESLVELFNNAVENGVGELSWCDQDKINELAKFLNVHNAFFSAGTSILNIGDALKKIEIQLQKDNFYLMKNQEVKELKFENGVFSLTTQKEKLTADIVINAAGLGAVAIREFLGLTDFCNEYVKGNYVKLKKKFYNESLLYPVPPKGLKGLGVHTSFGEDGIIRFGPNTEDVNSVNYQIKESVVESMAGDILKVFKGISQKDLEVDYCGIRPKIRKNNQLYSDFYISNGEAYGLHRYIECLGVESPGLTSSPAIARKVSEIVKSLV
ncbi:NAD(P)/FAD-dependent oxidoreductase [Halobacteriovorax sp. HLS]|uniref:NAD(P)/FAD-dependent oxidoreductase n=1 Tax=Halobacteriovorax sp. HLS TaxID=2234000 RepID=UPI000FD88C44|nr:FAD-dependent oxidoreductase [Halobacteriovorax sp. HLS]